jgi:hypothetical protein
MTVSRPASSVQEMETTLTHGFNYRATSHEPPHTGLPDSTLVDAIGCTNLRVLYLDGFENTRHLEGLPHIAALERVVSMFGARTPVISIRHGSRTAGAAPPRLSGYSQRRGMCCTIDRHAVSYRHPARSVYTQEQTLSHADASHSKPSNGPGAPACLAFCDARAQVPQGHAHGHAASLLLSLLQNYEVDGTLRRLAGIVRAVMAHS